MVSKSPSRAAHGVVHGVVRAYPPSPRGDARGNSQRMPIHLVLMRVGGWVVADSRWYDIS